MMLTACSGSKPAETTAAAADTTAAAAETTAAAAPSGDVQKLTMGTGGTTGTYYAYGGVIANVLNSKDIGVNINVQSTGASKANIYLVNDGEADLATVQDVYKRQSRQREVLYGHDVVSDIFLENLKSATPWILKSVNIKLLADQVDHGKREHLLHICAHFSNLIKVSEQVGVRHDAGRALLRLAHLLTTDQRNEIAVELLKGLEVEMCIRDRSGRRFPKATV